MFASFDSRLAAGPVGAVYWMLGGTWGLYTAAPATRWRHRARALSPPGWWLLLVAAMLVVLARVGLWQQAFVSDRMIRFFAWALAAIFVLETLAGLHVE